jgi:hypothetical protein
MGDGDARRGSGRSNGSGARIARATRVIVEADPFGFHPRPTRAGRAIGGVAGRKEYGRGGAETTGVPGLRRRWLVVNGNRVGDPARHGRLV